MKRATADTARRATRPGREVFNFVLYVAGRKPRSIAAYENLKRLCEQYLEGRYAIDVVDLYKHPEKAREADLAALPTLVRRLPLPLRRIVGDLSRTDEILLAIGYTPGSET